MKITNFKINELRTEIDVTITDATDVNLLYIWTDKTYKDYNRAIDLTNKLSGFAVETITITLDDLSIPFFDGVYFLEAEDDDEVSQAIESDLTKYEECIINKLIELNICEDCLNESSIDVLNAQSLLTGLKVSIQNGFLNEIFSILKSLGKYCSNDCKTCGNYNNIKDDNFFNINLN